MVDVRIDRCRTFWTPTESVATKPLCMDLVTNAPAGTSIRCYAVHDANKQQKSAKGKRLRRPTAILKHLRGLTSRGARSGMPRRSGNCHVSALVAGSTLVAGYRYAPFGAVVQAVGVCAAMNPFRFSSEYADDELGLVYYNYRHYNPLDGRWVNRDPIDSTINLPLCVLDSKRIKNYNNYLFVDNGCIKDDDYLGLFLIERLCKCPATGSFYSIGSTARDQVINGIRCDCDHIGVGIIHRYFEECHAKGMLENFDTVFNYCLKSKCWVMHSYVCTKRGWVVTNIQITACGSN